MIQSMLERATGRTPAYEPRGFVTPMSVTGLVLSALGIAGFFTRRLVPRAGFLWLFGSSTLLSVGLSLLGTSVVRELAAQRMTARIEDLDRVEAGIQSQIGELDPFARVQLLARLAQDEVGRYGIGRAA